MVVQLPRRLFTTDEYFRMVEAGILTKDDHVELIEGEIVEMPPTGDYHAGILSQLTMLFKSVLGTEAVLRHQDPLRLSSQSAPQPDFAVVKFRPDFYKGSHPGPEDVLLLIEIADSSLTFDRRVKAPLYGQAGVRELWIVNIKDRTIEVYREPSDAGFRAISIVRGQERVSPAALPTISFSVGELLD
jgi:hypothetical protein